MEERVVVARVVVLRPGSELLVGGHEGRCDIMRQKKSLRVDVQELDDVVVTNYTTTTSLWERLSRDDLPVVVRVLVAITSNLLT